MRTFIEVELLKTYAPKKKLEIVNSLSVDELLRTPYEMILKIIKEVGTGDPKKVRNKFKTLYLKEAGNDWNSKVVSIRNCKKDEIWLSVYIQGDDTDTTVDYKLSDFLDNSREIQYIGKLHESFRNGYEHDITAIYNREARSKVIKEILVTYLTRKYQNKL